MEDQDESVLEVYTRREVVAATLWLHGLGVNASDLNAILVNLEQTRELGVHYLAPNAPIRPITVNDGRPARAWYDVAGAPEEVPGDRAGIEASARWIRSLLKREAERGIPSEATILAGFSQGGALALHLGLRLPTSLAGIVVLAGELLLPETLAEERHPANADTPIVMIHGADDPIVPLAVAEASRDRLRDLGYQVEWHEVAGGHKVAPETVDLVDRWMHERLEAVATTPVRP